MASTLGAVCRAEFMRACLRINRAKRSTSMRVPFGRVTRGSFPPLEVDRMIRGRSPPAAAAA